MAVVTRYKGVTLSFERMPSPAEIERAYEARKAQGLRPNPPRDDYPLAAAQQPIWFHEQTDRGTATYNVAVAFSLSGELDLHAFAESVEQLFARHDALRMRVESRDGVPRLFVAVQVDATLAVVDVSHVREPRRDAACDRRVQALFEAPFDLARAPLARFELVKMGPTSYVLILAFHHLIVDARSIDVLVADLGELYRARTSGLPLPPPRAQVGYADYLLWQEEQLAAGGFDEPLARWERRLAGELPVLDLLPDRLRTSAPRYEGGFAKVAVPRDVVLGVRRLSRELRASPYMVVLAATAALLSRYAGQQELVLGSPFAGRAEPSLADVVGLFVNVLPIRVDVAKGTSFRSLVAHVCERVLEAQEGQQVPLPQILSRVGVDREPGRTPLFQALITYLPAPTPARFGDVIARPLFLEPKSAKFEVSFTFVDGDEHALLAADFRRDLYDPETIEAMLAHLGRVLATVTSTPDLTVEELPLLAPEERERLVRGVNDATLPLPDICVHELVERVASAHPTATAVVHDAVELTYRELDDRADRLAHAMGARGVEPDRLVVLLLEQGVDVVTAMLAAAKAGGAYLPLDPADPVPRLRGIIEDAEPALVVASARTAHLAAELAREPLVLRPGWHDELPAPDGRRRPRVFSDSLLNVLYTSGSTGVPKGVALSHRGVVRLVHRPNFAKLGPDDVMPQLSPLYFDGATYEIWGALTAGAKLVVTEKSIVLSPRDLSEMLRRHRVTTLLLTTPLLNRLIEDAPEALSGLSRVIFGGEIISKPHMQKALGFCRPGTLLHTYGPTEGSFTSCFYPIREVQADAWTIPIGQPVSNTDIYVLDERLEPVPFGVVGEIWLGGDGLARGYLDDPAMTAGRFVPNPFAGGEGRPAGARMYRTGDRGRRLRSGLIEFVGRLDNQVKIRSQRVELGEIETALRQQPLVGECFVTAVSAKGGSKQIVAYIVPAGAAEPGAAPRQITLPEASLSDLRQALRARLPDYMVPAHVVAMTGLPLNPNGKVNRKALPAAEAALEVRTLFATEGDTERGVARIWSDILGLERVSANDSFFEVGGDSLSLVRVQVGVEKAFGLTLPILSLFEHPTVRTLAREIDARLGRAASPPRAAPAPAAAKVANTGPVLRGHEPIAVIGMSIRAPKAEGLDAFWSNLVAGHDCIERFPDAEAEGDSVRRFGWAGERWVRAGGLLERPFHFDAGFFDMSPSEAKRTDPQQRIFLECVWEALEDAGVELAGSGARVSVYTGAAPCTYGLGAGDNPSGAESLVDAVAQNAMFVATRTSFKLNLKGESIMVDTLCSTSLVAVHMACASLLRGESDYAIAGGVNVQLPQKVGYLYEPSFILSPDGRCRPFDKDAGGTVPSNGAGVVLLRRLTDALRDGDPIRAVIRGSAVNNDGFEKIGYYAPSIQGQVDVIARAQQVAGIDPSTISYVEAHGTATSLGDPIEVSALAQVFGARTSKKGFCGIGSVKSNVGHLGVAAGVAGLVKAILALQHRALPPSVHFREPNPRIDFSTTPFFVIGELRPWDTGPSPRRAGVSSYGIGGTNAHVVVEEAP